MEYVIQRKKKHGCHFYLEKIKETHEKSDFGDLADFYAV